MCKHCDMDARAHTVAHPPHTKSGRMTRYQGFSEEWELEREYRVAKAATAARHYQAIWLLAKGHTVPEVAEMTSFETRWLEQLCLVKT